MTLRYARRFIDPNNQYRRWIDPRIHNLRLGEVVAYLLHRGWKELPPDRGGFRVFQEPTGETINGKPFCQFVPDSEGVDLSLRMFELLTGLAEVENRQAAEVIDDIVRLASHSAKNGAAEEEPEDAEVSRN
jgi:hypothetical protein